MPSYYTYGEMPNPKETVYGPLSQSFAEGGEVFEDYSYFPMYENEPNFSYDQFSAPSSGLDYEYIPVEEESQLINEDFERQERDVREQQLARQAEAQRIAAEQEAARFAEQQRVAREQQLAREAEAARRAEEEARTRREVEAAQKEQERVAAEQTQLEQERQAEAARVEQERVAAPLQSAVEEQRETTMPTPYQEPVYEFGAPVEELINVREDAQPTAETAPLSEPEREGTMPTGEEAPLTQPAPPEAAPPESAPTFSYFEPGLTTPVTPTGGTFEAGQKAMALASLIDPSALKGIGVGDAAFGGAGTSGAAVPDYFRAVAPDTVGGQGSFYEEGALEAAKEAAKDPTQGLFKSGFDALAGEPGIEEAIKAKADRDLAAIAKVEASYDVMKPISDLLKANKFEEAFAYAKEKGVVDKMMTPGWLEQLRQPFTAQEMKAFYNAIPPDYRGSDFKFDPNRGQVSESGYPEPLSAFKYEQPLTAIDAIIRLGGATVLGAGALSALGGAGAAGAGAAGAGGAGAGAAGAAGAGTTGGLSGLGAAIKSGATALAKIPAYIGTKVGGLIGLDVAGLNAAALGNAVISGGMTAAKGGDLEDVLKAGLLAAGVTYVTAPMLDGLKTAAKSVANATGIGQVGPIPLDQISQAINDTVGQAVAGQTATDLAQIVVSTSKLGATAGALAGTGAALAQRPSGTERVAEPERVTEPEDLKEVTVTGTRVQPPLATVPTPGLIDIKPKNIVPEYKPTEVVEPTPEEDLEEIEVTAKRPEPLTVSVPTPPLMQVTPETIVPEYKPTEITQPLDEDLEEIEVTAKRPEPLAISVPTPPLMQVTPEAIAPEYKPTEVTQPIDEDLEEIEVTAKRPEPLKVSVPTPPLMQVTPKAILPEYKPTEVVEPVDEDLEEIKVTAKRPPPFELSIPAPPLIDIKTADIAKDYKPTEVKPPEKSELQKLLEKYGTLENLLKVIGAISAASSKTPTTTATTPKMPSLGGALPKYTYTRQQLSPDIDYYTYGTRPEAKFFEQGFQLEKPVQPPAPPADVNPPDENKPMAYGGLTGYAHGGSHSSRYVDGPGSGRDDKIPALLSDGEYVIDAETLALLGDGSTKEGARRMDRFRANIRRHKGRALSRGRISPNAKSPDKYMGGGLT